MSLVRQRARMQVVRHENGVARVDSPFRYGLYRFFQVLPSGTLAQHRIHAEPHLCQRILAVRRLMAAAHACGDICVQLPRRVLLREVARRRFACAKGGGDFLVHTGIALHYARIIHHFPEPDYGFPGHGAADILRPDLSAGILKTRHCGHAGPAL